MKGQRRRRSDLAPPDAYPMQIYYNDRHSLHATAGLVIDGQPFLTEDVPERVDVLLQAVREAQIGPIFPPYEHGLDPIRAVHPDDYLHYLQTAYQVSRAYFGKAIPVFPETFAVRGVRRRTRHPIGQPGYYGFGVGTPILAGSWEAAYWSAQCALSAADRLLAGSPAAYALCRPPGHHAGTDLYGGFCFLNNAAIAARYLGGRLAILDVDYHHGNGTQEIFYDDPSVLYLSLHAHPDDDYPFFWGGAEERGAGPGEGFNWNWPLPQGTGDADYLRALGSALNTIAGFKPSCLIVSLGFDIGQGDPAGGFRITPAGFREIGEQIAGVHLPTLIVQEGGYLLEKLGVYARAFFEKFGGF